MEEAYFLVRFTPFWAIPIMMIGGEFAYLFWIRKKKKLMLMCLAFFTISFVMSAFYFIAGGPEKSVRVFIELVHFYTR